MFSTIDSLAHWTKIRRVFIVTLIILLWKQLYKSQHSRSVCSVPHIYTILFNCCIFIVESIAFVYILRVFGSNVAAVVCGGWRQTIIGSTIPGAAYNETNLRVGFLYQQSARPPDSIQTPILHTCPQSANLQASSFPSTVHIGA